MFISNAQKIFLTWNLFQNYFLKRSPWKGFPLNNFEGFALLSNKLVPILPLKDLVPSQDSFLQISEWRNWKYFPGKYVKALKIAYIKIFSRGHFRKWFWRYLEVKNECSDRLNIIFHFSANFLSEEVATIIWESKTKPWKLFKSKFCQSGHFRKCFWSYHQVKKECFEGLKIELFPFCKFLGNKVKTIFWERKAYP